MNNHHTFKQLNHVGFITVGVQLSYTELRYDIDFITNRIAKLAGVDAKTQLLITTEGADNDDFIARLLTTSLASLKHRTSWASGERGGRMVTDELPEDIEDYMLVFHLPLTWRGNANVLCALCHEYVKNKTVSDWCRNAVPDQGNNYEIISDGNIGDIAYELRKQPPKPQTYKLV